jgi:hypothetical protein
VAVGGGSIPRALRHRRRRSLRSAGALRVGGGVAATGRGHGRAAAAGWRNEVAGRREAGAPGRGRRVVSGPTISWDVGWPAGGKRVKTGRGVWLVSHWHLGRRSVAGWPRVWNSYSIPRVQNITTIYISVCVKVPEGIDIPNKNHSRNMYCVKLQKSLYGLKQSGRMWYSRLNEFLLQKGFSHNDDCPCVFIKESSILY